MDKAKTNKGTPTPDALGWCERCGMNKELVEPNRGPPTVPGDNEPIPVCANCERDMKQWRSCQDGVTAEDVTP